MLIDVERCEAVTYTTGRQCERIWKVTVEVTIPSLNWRAAPSRAPRRFCAPHAAQAEKSGGFITVVSRPQPVYRYAAQVLVNIDFTAVEDSAAERLEKVLKQIRQITGVESVEVERLPTRYDLTNAREVEAWETGAWLPAPTNPPPAA